MTLLVKNVYVSGGAAPSEVKTDIFISGDRISAIGEFPEKSATYVLEGKGAEVTPGFIDIVRDSHYTFGPMVGRVQKDTLSDGVTTMFLGHCGTSLAPYLRRTAEFPNVDWHTVGEFLRHLGTYPKGVHIGTLVGYQTLVGGVGNEHRELTAFLDQALLEGAFGLSRGMREEISQKLLDPLLSRLSASGALYAPRLRSRGEGLQKEVQELVELAEKKKVKTLITHFLPEQGGEDEWKKVLETIEKSDYVYVAVEPLGRETAPFHHFLPGKLRSLPWEKLEEQLGDKKKRKEILDGMHEFTPHTWRITSAPEHPPLVGKTLADIMEGYEIDKAKEALLTLMELTRLRGVAEYSDTSPALVREVLSHPRVLLGSHGTLGSFQGFLNTVEEHRVMTRGEAIAKLTTLPVEVLGLEQRGKVKEGSVADLTGMKDGEVQFVIVGGKVAFKDKECSRIPAGGALYHDARS